MATPHWSDRPFATVNSVPPTRYSPPRRGEAGVLAEAIVETIVDPLLVLDRHLCVVTANRAFYRRFKFDAQEVEGRPFHSLGNGRWNLPELTGLLADLLRHKVLGTYEIETNDPHLGPRMLLLNARKLVYDGNYDRQILLTIEDITERRAAERETAALLHQKNVLLREMQHRVANSLQMIASILLLKARNVQSEEIRLHLKDAHQRIMSVAAVEQQLDTARHEGRIELAPYLSQLCETLAGSMVGDGHRISIRVEAGSGTASPTEAVSIGLIVTELVINALKHAFVAGTEAGLIVVAYAAGEAGWRLCVSDNGVGKPNGGGDAAPGLGTGIVDALARQLDGLVETSRGPDGMGTQVAIIHGSFTDRGTTP
jgi:two-component sensor histidine kinase